MESSLDRLLSVQPIEQTYVRGSLLIVPLSDKVVKETNYIDLEKIIEPQRNKKFISKIKLLIKSKTIQNKLIEPLILCDI